jgi:hypothetical protein
MAVLAAIDFFTAEVLTWRGLTTYYVPFVTQLETRRVTIAGVTPHRFFHETALKVKHTCSTRAGGSSILVGF